MTAAHPLKGKVLRWGDEESVRYWVRRFLVPLGGGLWLTQSMSPRDGTDLAEQYLMSLAQIAAGEERGALYDSWAAMKEADDHRAILYNLHQLKGKARAKSVKGRRRAIRLVPDDSGPRGAA